MPTTQLSAKLTAASAKRRIDCSTAFAITGLNTLSSKWPWLPAKAAVAPLPITCAQTMVSASAWVGLTLPGMIEEPGSFSGSDSSPRPQRGPDASHRMSLAIFMSATATPRTAAIAATIPSSEPWAANLFGAVTNGLPVSSAICFAMSREKPFGAFSPVPTAVPPQASS